MGASLEAMIKQAEALDARIKAARAEQEADKVASEIGGKVSEAITRIATESKVEVKTLHGKFFALTVDEAGKLAVELVKKANGGKKASNGNGHSNGNGNGHQYRLKDGQVFDRVVDAIEALTGKPCTLQHDGRTFQDGKPVLRYERLTKELKAAITEVEKPKTEAKTEAK